MCVERHEDNERVKDPSNDLSLLPCSLLNAKVNGDCSHSVSQTILRPVVINVATRCHAIKIMDRSSLNINPAHRVHEELDMHADSTHAELPY